MKHSQAPKVNSNFQLTCACMGAKSLQSCLTLRSPLDVMEISNICQSGEKYNLSVVLICIFLITSEMEHIF